MNQWVVSRLKSSTGNGLSNGVKRSEVKKGGFGSGSDVLQAPQFINLELGIWSYIDMD